MLMDDGHRTAEPAKHLAKLEPNIAAAEHQQVCGQLAQFHDGGVGEERDRIQSGHVGNAGTGAGIDEDVFPLQHLLSDPDGVRGKKPCRAPVEVQVRAGVHAALVPGAEPLHDAILPGDNCGQIHRHARGPYAPARGVVGVVRHLGTGNHRLGGRTPGVDAGAAEVLLLDQGHRPTLIGEFLGERVPGLPGTDHDGVVQPVLIQVPPSSLRSMSATVLPRSASRRASGVPPCPEPMMIASYFMC